MSEALNSVVEVVSGSAEIVGQVDTSGINPRDNGKHSWLRAGTIAAEAGKDIGVDREKKVIRGYVVAQEGDFKTPGRGSFDRKALRSIIKMMREDHPMGLKSRFAHPTLSDDGIGKYLGRAKNPRRDTILKKVGTKPDGQPLYQELEIIRADLHLDESSFSTPSGNLGEYVMNLAESDPDAMSSSLVLESDQEQQLDERGKPKVNDKNEPYPPLWRPTKLHASDVVDTGDAVDGFLSAENLPDAIVRRGVELLDKQFAGVDRGTIRDRCLSWLNRYLELRFGPEEEAEKPPEPTPVASDDGLLLNTFIACETAEDGQ